MKILVTNDDGISAPGLWTLASKLKGIAQVMVVAPDREQSATGTSVTLRQPLRVQKATPMVTGVEAYSVEGTPCDSVILALGKLMENNVDLVISGINQGLNLGDDILISGTVGAALQAYLRGLPALAISVANTGKTYLDNAAKIATLLAKKIDTNGLPKDILLNINLPDLPLAEIKGIKVTQPAHKTHIDTVEEGHDGKRKYYWLVRQKLGTDTNEKTDIRALEQGNISITALHTTLFGKPLSGITEGFCSKLLQELRQS